MTKTAYVAQQTDAILFGALRRVLTYCKVVSKLNWAGPRMRIGYIKQRRGEKEGNSALRFFLVSTMYIHTYLLTSVSQAREFDIRC